MSLQMCIVLPCAVLNKCYVSSLDWANKYNLFSWSQSCISHEI